MTNSPPPLPTGPPPAKSFAHQAARLSWVCPLIMILFVVVGRQSGSVLLIDLIGLFFILAGLTFSIIAFLGIPKHGVKGILAQALAGLLINGLFLFIFVSNFLAARAQELQHAS